ncbi:MAG: hypothetical protein ABH871_05315 [Pseudomonadota bacterium]
MKRKKGSKVFLQELCNLIGALKNMKPGETHVLSINANYGNYQLVIGPGAKRQSAQNGDKRPIEINGEIHHLFATPAEVRPHPSKQQIIDNLKDTVIMKAVSIHLKDPMGDGMHLKGSDGNDNGLHAREFINLAGNKGDEIIDKMEHDDDISFKTYQLVQKDILKSLKEHKKESLEAVD